MVSGNTKGERPTKKRTSFKKTSVWKLTRNREARDNYPFLRRSEQNAIFIYTLHLNGIPVTTKIEKEIASHSICNTKDEAIEKAKRFAMAKRLRG